MGFDPDGLTSASPPGGVGGTVVGCRKTDLVGGIDHGFGAVATKGGALRIRDSDLASGTAAWVVLLTHLNSTTATDDPCVSLEVPVTNLGIVSSASGLGAASAARLTGALGAPVVLPLSMPPPSYCANATPCAAGDLALVLSHDQFDSL